jgi:hypothetical protein
MYDDDLLDDLLTSLFVGDLLDARDAANYVAEHSFKFRPEDVRTFRLPLSVGAYADSEVVLVLRHLAGVKSPAALPTMLPLPLPPGFSTKA